MAEFCTSCAERYGMIADIDVEKLSAKLKRGEEITLLCEGCGLKGLKRDENGRHFRGYSQAKEREWVKILEDLV